MEYTLEISAEFSVFNSCHNKGFDSNRDLIFCDDQMQNVILKLKTIPAVKC